LGFVEFDPRMKNRCRLLTFVAGAVVAASASAQAAPRLGASLEAGPENVVGGEFTQYHSGLSLLGAGHVRLFAVQRTAVIATAAYELMGSSGDVVSLCIPSPHGGCKPAAPGFHGWSWRFGVERSVTQHLFLGASSGFGWYANNATKAPAGAHVIPVRLELRIPISHVAVTFAGEHTAFRDFGGEYFYSNAARIGLRVP
jgi:hypothetical protein